MSGASPTNAHWSVNLPYNHKESETERRARRTRDRAALEAAGFKLPEYFRFKTTDSAEVKAAAKVKADARAAVITAKTGVVLSVCEGCFL